jgi:hypothetical protein
MHGGTTTDAGWLFGADFVRWLVGSKCFCFVFVCAPLVVRDDRDDVDDRAEAEGPDEPDDPGGVGDEVEAVDEVDVVCALLLAWERIDACRRRAGAGAAAGAGAGAGADGGSVAAVCAEARVFDPSVDVVLGLDVPHAARATVSASPAMTSSARSRALPRGWSAGTDI